jgi:hypothetical protein
MVKGVSVCLGSTASGHLGKARVETASSGKEKEFFNLWSEDEEFD